MRTVATIVAALALLLVAAACTTNNYNCNVKDACRTSGEAPG